MAEWLQFLLLAVGGIAAPSVGIVLGHWLESRRQSASALAELETAVGAVQAELGTIQDSLKEVQTSVGTIGPDVEEVQTSVGTIQTDVAELKQTVRVLPDLRAQVLDLTGKRLGNPQ